MVSVDACWLLGVAGALGEAAHVLSGHADGTKVCAPSADGAGMIPDLLLALASVAVLLSPFFIDAARNYEFRKSLAAREAFWND
jgi:hypothetical protein